MEHSYRVLTPRLMLRPFTEHDLEHVRGWRNHEQLLFQEEALSQTEQHLNGYERYRQNEHDMMFMAVHLKDEKPIGTGALFRVNRTNSSAEFGRVLIGNSDYQGLGLGEEIVKGLTQFGIVGLGLNTIELYVKITNTRAIKIYMNCGYVHDRTFRHYGPKSSGGSLIRMICTYAHYHRENLN